MKHHNGGQGRNKAKCEKYRREGRAAVNKKRRAEKREKKLTKLRKSRVALLA